MAKLISLTTINKWLSEIVEIFYMTSNWNKLYRSLTSLALSPILVLHKLTSLVKALKKTRQKTKQNRNHAKNEFNSRRTVMTAFKKNKKSSHEISKIECSAFTAEQKKFIEELKISKMGMLTVS